MAPHFRTRFVFLPLFAWISLTPLWADPQPTVTGIMNPSEVHVGDSFTITITVHNTTSADIDFPAVSALEEVSHENSTNFSVSNGSYEAEVSLSTIFIAREAGLITVPPTEVKTADGQTIEFHSFQIRILPEGDSNNTTIPVPPPNTGITQTPPTTTTTTTPDTNTPPPPGDTEPASNPIPLDSVGKPLKYFCKVTPQTTDAYVGQSIPLMIQFFIQEDFLAQQDSLPDLQGSDFMMNSLLDSHSLVNQVVSNDCLYNEDRWITNITPLKPGDLSLVLTRETNWRPPTVLTFFSNPYRRQPTNRDSVSNAAIIMHVKPLPDKGRPSDYNGSVGDFQVVGAATPTQVIIGEPVQIQFDITGQGNFDRVSCPIIPTSPQWKAYPSKSAVRFSDSSETTGIKSFQLSMVPQQQGSLPIPEPHYSYFNPKTQQYVTIQIPLPNVTVLPSSAPLAHVTGAAPPPTDDPQTTPNPDSAALRPNLATLGNPIGSVVPIYKNLPFQITLTTTIFLFLLSTGIKTLKDQYTNAEQQKLSKSLRQTHAEIKKHLLVLQGAKTLSGPANDLLFLDTARTIISQTMASRWRVSSPESITRLDLETREPILAAHLSHLLDKLDELHYSGRSTGPIESATKEQWCQLVQSITKYFDRRVAVKE